MDTPVIEPGRVRSDLRYLRFDTMRPSMLLRASRWRDAAKAPGPETPLQLIERIERGLAESASSYRIVMRLGLVTLLMPFFVMTVMYAIYRRTYTFEPFYRGAHIPYVSVYEVVSFGLLAVLLAIAGYHAYQSTVRLAGLGFDLVQVKDAEEPRRAEIAAEAASGRWPRLAAILQKGRGFEAYRSDPVASPPAERV